MDPVFLFICLMLALLCGAIGMRITKGKGRSGGAGFWLGFLFGPLGILIAAILSTDHSARDESEDRHDTRTCPDCAELVKRAARKCKHCGLVFEQVDYDGEFARSLAARRIFRT
jgi:uncharacterized protein UPF0547